MRIKLLTFLMCCAMTFSHLFAQLHQSVFPNDTGDNLLEKLVDNYKAESVLPNSMARDTLFAVVDGKNDSLKCVYTGHTIYLDPSLDPTQAAYMNGGPNGINTEHTYPQSMGASGLAQSDMHHLFPTLTNVNGDRGSLPFADINDAQTQEWYYLNQSSGSIPSQNINLYSEGTDTQFEPREDHKGNVARAIFYFYTMYKAQADAANSTFFESQRQTLCAWHHLDPVDQKEWNRTFKIAPYQDNLPNPFVLDCTLPERSFCMNVGMQCEPVSTGSNVAPTPFELLPNIPNPVTSFTAFQYSLAKSFHVKLSIVDIFGKQLVVLVNEPQVAGVHEINWTLDQTIPNGIVIVHLEIMDGKNTFSKTQKIGIIR